MPHFTARPVRALFVGAVVAILVAITATSIATSGAANAVDNGKGYAGFCKSDKGVTVVVDFQGLGGKTLVRCNPSGTRGTGLDALKNAGFQISGVQRWGESFICRVENRPSAIEKLAIKGNEGYREACIDTPPASAYWSYWHAGNNCAWKYSQWGVKNRDYVQGGFEGWSFSLNATAETNPLPRIAAVRPGTKGGQCVEPEEHAPTTNDPNERQPGSTADNGYKPDEKYGQDGRTSDDPNDPDNDKNSADDKGLPAPEPRQTTKENVVADPADNVTFSGGEDAPDVNEVIKKQANASDMAPFIAVGLMLVLGVLAWLVARRRRRVRLDL